jgi:hypothetical protein
MFRLKYLSISISIGIILYFFPSMENDKSNFTHNCHYLDAIVYSSTQLLTKICIISKYSSEKASVYLPEQTLQKQCMLSAHSHQGASVEKPIQAKDKVPTISEMNRK